jgi:hypothetical protein
MTLSRASSPRVYSDFETRRSFSLRLLRRGVRNGWAVRRARGAMCVGTWRHMPFSRHMAPCAFGEHTARLLWAATTEAGKRLRSARDGLIGLQLPAGPRPWPLDGMLGSPHCWVLGPPTSCAGHRPFTGLHGARHLGHAAARKARTRDGAVASRSTPTMRPARFLTGAGRPKIYSYRSRGGNRRLRK